MKYTLTFTIIFLFFLGCNLAPSKKNSLLIIAVESLSFNNLNCFDTKIKNLKNFCNESIRFTHTFSPSPLAQASLTSLLFGKLPKDHKVIHNGNNFISNKKTSLAETAIKKGFKTSLFSGGLNIWRKSGLAQGFEVFDDNIKVEEGALYRNALDNIKLFNRWVNTISNNLFFSVIYLPDLEFNNIQKNDNLQKIDSAFYMLKKNLKNLKRWDNTQVIFIGLNGDQTQFKHNVSKGLNLYSENTKVSLLIKPSTIKRDLALNWTVDDNIDFPALHKSIDLFLKTPLPKNNIIIESIKNFSKNNPIKLIESAWPQWREVASSRFAIRNNQFYTIYDKDIKIFNSFSDRDEQFPFNSNDILFQKHSSIALRFFTQNNLESFNYSYSPLLDKIKIASQIFNLENSELILSNLSRLTKKIYWDKNLITWELKYLLKLRKWDLLTERASFHNFKLAQFVGQQHLKKITRLNFPCKEYFRLNKYPVKNYKRCNDPLLKLAYNWVSEANRTKKLRRFYQFIRVYRSKKLTEKIELLNYANGLTWDTRLQPGRETLYTELFLNLPKNKNYLQQLLKQKIPQSF